MRRTAVTVTLLVAITTAAWAGDPVKKRMKVLEMIRQHVFAVFYDPAGPPHWDRIWEKKLLPLTEEEDVCRFYARLNQALASTGVSHLVATPPGSRKGPGYKERLDVIHFDGHAWIGRSPAVTSLGLIPGTEILSINNEPYFSYFNRYICGENKKPRYLSLKSPDGTLTEFKIPRRWPKTGEGGAIVSVSRPAPGIGCLQVDSFKEGDYRPHDIENALKTLGGAEALIIDLRRNMGGHMLGVRHLLSHFFNNPIELGRYVSLRNETELRDAMLYYHRFAVKTGAPLYRSGERKESMTVTPARKPFTGPLAVLVGRSTASMAEIAARCLQSSGRAILIGERTAGAVLPASSLKLPDGGHLWLPLFNFIDSSGATIEGSGVVPGITVSWQLDDLVAGRDPAMEAGVAHLEDLRNGDCHHLSRNR